ncbi:AAA family ATPase [Brevibacillus sp. H7]|uniref:AAA family ATPase n=1 Tax=Brevibacillus sp. H7 TaxID=3349138 RepID=UPI00382E287F
MQLQKEAEQLHLIGNTDVTKLSEGELIPILRRIEEFRQSTDGVELDQAEAAVLTRLAALRLGKPGGSLLAEEWLSRARLLAPDYLPAARHLCRLYLSMLSTHPFGDRFPVIRETDNAVTRKRQLEVLIGEAEQERAILEKWQEVADKAKQAAVSARDEEALILIDHLLRLYGERDHLLHQLLERAHAYAASLQGMFYSTELLVSVQDSVKQLAEQEAQREELFARYFAEQSEPETSPGVPSALELVEELVGLFEIKQRVHQLARFYQYQKLRTEKGWQLKDQLPLHLVLMGNPGTGKTTLARLIARLYYELGLLERSDVVEVDRSHLVGAYIGQTEQRTMDVIKRAAGGVLFIDEAYSLKRADQSGSDYGQVAVDTLVAAMTGGEYAGKFVVILAGYPEEMRQFLFTNSGLRSRFPESGHFLLPDYSTEELLQIAEQVAARNDFSLTKETRQALADRINRERVDETFGNARTVTNIVLDAIFAKGKVMGGKQPLHVDDFTILYPEDVLPQGWKEQKSDAELPAQIKLERLIGLDQVKAELNKIAAFVSIQQKRVESGLNRVPIELHAVFTGNPGTGKTSVAKLYAQMLREIGYLKRGHLVTAGRADLVAGYVGQTAALTRRKIREALGGVLFIDEAYALANGGERDFGREAIHTLVEEMTKHEENLVVVLAGYPLEMERLLDSNPGLASRFKKFIHFPDYTPDELFRIIQLAVQEAGYQLSGEAEASLERALREAAEQGILSGNGRLAFNLVQEAIQNQALRLSQIPVEEMDAALLSELAWCDFQSLLQTGGKRA